MIRFYQITCILVLYAVSLRAMEQEIKINNAESERLIEKAKESRLKQFFSKFNIKLMSFRSDNTADEGNTPKQPATKQTIGSPLVSSQSGSMQEHYRQLYKQELFKAIDKQNLIQVKEAIKELGSLNFYNDNGDTPLSKAARAFHKAVDGIKSGDEISYARKQKIETARLIFEETLYKQDGSTWQLRQSLPLDSIERYNELKNLPIFKDLQELIRKEKIALIERSKSVKTLPTFPS